ncbi:unnamed protein product [Lactuca saligna]|uniref:Uncharacterized protein n=1 Tax=Lactuca saligna TaxID=75948 RepID=A0AA35ZWK7_LACSI|nr:unnamed protein product [Lactuca saligna]
MAFVSDCVCAAAQPFVRMVMCAAAHILVNMGDLEFAKVHNSTMFLEDPSAAHNDLKFIIDGLRKCCLVSAFTIGLVIYQSLIKEFWRSAIVKKDDNEDKYLEATVQGKNIMTKEHVIQESLHIIDIPEFSMQIDTEQTQEVLDHIVTPQNHERRKRSGVEDVMYNITTV